jgi:hypothetical protein
MRCAILVLVPRRRQLDPDSRLSELADHCFRLNLDQKTKVGRHVPTNCDTLLDTLLSGHPRVIFEFKCADGKAKS